MNSKRYLPFLLILALVGCCIEVDISIPSFPEMARYFGTSEESIQWTLSVNFLGVCLSSLLWGPLSETFGRRKIMLLGNTLFLLGGLGSAFAFSIDWLIVCRFFQGFGASATFIIAIAMIADAFHGEKAAKYLGLINSCITAFMAVAPVAGGFINKYLGWRSNYSSVALISLITVVLMALCLPETKERPDPWDPRTIFSNYLKLFTSRYFLKCSFIPSILVAGYLSFMACGAFLYIDEMHVPILYYSLCQGLIVASFSVMSYFSGSIISRLGKDVSVKAFSLLSFIAAIGLFAMAIYAPYNPYLLTAFMCIYGAACAIVYTAIFTESMEIFPEIRGFASSALMFMRMFMCAATVWLMGRLYQGHLFPIAIVMLSMVLFTILLLVTLKRPEKAAEIT